MSTTTQRAALADIATTDEDMTASGMPIEDVALVSIGGGLGSFALVDRLRLGGAAADDIRVVTPHLKPDQVFSAACRASGLASEDELRSDSAARIDNPWGFPGYALEEAWRSKRIGPLARVLFEPVLCEPYTPTVALMQKGIARETQRIGWTSMVAQGTAERVIKRAGGGYFVVRRARGDRRAVYRCHNVHLALGAAGPQITPEAAVFRDQSTHGDQVVHVYEPHEHVYQDLVSQGGSVLVRGAGIAASRVLERLIEDRDASGRNVHIWHLFRHYDDSGHGFSYQPFDFPKAAFSGQLRDTTSRLPEAERIDLIRELGSTSTPYRKTWATQLRRGREEGWYDAVVGEVSTFRSHQGRVDTHVRLGNGEDLKIPVNYVIDATGLDMATQHHPLVADLVAHTGASVNALAGLRVDDDFAVVGCDSGGGRVFATGMTARGARLAPVDSFAGLQSAALTIADRLAEQGLGGRLTPARSATAWLKWMGGRSL